MNLRFADIGSSFLYPIHRDGPRAASLGNRSLTEQKTGQSRFAGFLNQQLGLSLGLSRGLSRDGAQPVLIAENRVSRSSRNQKTTIGATRLVEGLEAMKQMLVRAGFKESDVNDLFEDCRSLQYERPSPFLNKIQNMHTFQKTKIDANRLMERLSERSGNGSGFGFLSALKDLLDRYSQGDLSAVAIDREGLEAMKQMLVRAGFKESDVNDLFDGFQEALNTETLTLAVVMNSLFELPDAEKNVALETGDTLYLETWVIPFVESILNSLGIPAEEIQLVMNRADRGQKGIDLDSLIESLRSLQEKSAQDRKVFQTPEKDQNFKPILSRLGIDMGENKTTPLTLKEFTAELEVLRDNMVSDGLISQREDASSRARALQADTSLSSMGKQDSLLNDLFKGLYPLNSSEKTTGLSFSRDQAENQFQDQWLMGNDASSNESGLFSSDRDGQTGKEGKQANGFSDPAVPGREKSGLDVTFAGGGKEPKESFSSSGSPGKAAGNGDHSPSVSSEAAGNQALFTDRNVPRSEAAFRNLPSHVTHQVARSLVRAVNQGESTLTLQLKPPELGRLVMTIDHSGDTLKVTIMTESQTAKDILVSNTHDIKTALAGSGVHLEQFEVDMNTNFQQSMADAGHQAGQSGRDSRGRKKAGVNTAGEVSINDPDGLPDQGLSDGSVHYIV